MNQIVKFLSYLRAERGVAANTIAAYESDVRKFAGWIEKPFSQVQRTDMQRYISDLLNSGNSPRSAARRLACLRHFYRFLIDEGEAIGDPTRNLPVPKRWKTVPKALSLPDLETMVASLGHSSLDIRDRAILLT